MNREILFRGKRLDNTEWVEGYLYRNLVKAWIIFPHTGRARNGLFVGEEGTKFSAYTRGVEPSTICQYTGLADKNGRKIFEGDIVGFEDCTSTETGYWEQYCSGEVKWSNEEAQFYVTNRLMAESYEVLQDCEVIGNIFDNPELVEVLDLERSEKNEIPIYAGDEGSV